MLQLLLYVNIAAATQDSLIALVFKWKENPFLSVRKSGGQLLAWLYSQWCGPSGTLEGQRRGMLICPAACHWW